MKAAAALMTLALKLPHRPRSAVITTSSVFPPARGTFRSSSSGCADASTRAESRFSTRSICAANGRPCWMRSWARRSFDAATIFMALVICWVDLTARMRRRISKREGTRSRRLRRRRELVREFLESLVQIRLDLIVQLLLLDHRLQQLRAAGVEELEEL